MLEVPLFCDIGFSALLRTLFVASTVAVGQGLELLLFIASYCLYHAFKKSDFKNIMLPCFWHIFQLCRFENSH